MRSVIRKREKNEEGLTMIHFYVPTNKAYKYIKWKNDSNTYSQ